MFRWSQQNITLYRLCPWNSSSCANSGQSIHFKGRGGVKSLWLLGSSSHALSMTAFSDSASAHFPILFHLMILARSAIFALNKFSLMGKWQRGNWMRECMNDGWGSGPVIWDGVCELWRYIFMSYETWGGPEGQDIDFRWEQLQGVLCEWKIRRQRWNSLFSPTATSCT